LKAIPLEYNTGTFNLSKFENHKKYIDIHYIIQGQEQIALASTSDLEPNMEYDEINDYQLFDGKIGETINIKEGEFILLFPGEAHVTGGLIGDTSKSLKKVVFKVPV
jgi:YhcH/YjgK/YiaL family protein